MGAKGREVARGGGGGFWEGGAGGGGGRLCTVEGRADLAGIVHKLLQLFLAIIPLGDQAGPTRGLGAAASHAGTCAQATLLLCRDEGHALRCLQMSK